MHVCRMPHMGLAGGCPLKISCFSNWQTRASCLIEATLFFKPRMCVTHVKAQAAGIAYRLFTQVGLLMCASVVWSPLTIPLFSLSTAFKLHV